MATYSQKTRLLKATACVLVFVILTLCFLSSCEEETGIEIDNAVNSAVAEIESEISNAIGAGVESVKQAGNNLWERAKEWIGSFLPSKTHTSASWIIYDRYALASQQPKFSKSYYTFYDEAKIYEKELKKKYKNAEVRVIDVVSATEFQERWEEEIGFINGNAVAINEVIIIAHGSAAGEPGIGNMEFGSGPEELMLTPTYLWANGTRLKEDDERNGTIAGLSPKDIGILTFSTCNTANPDIYSLTDAFMEHKDMNIQTIIAWDGGTMFDHLGDKTLKPGAIGSKQPTFNDYNKTGRERIGKRVFENNNGEWKEREELRIPPK